VNLGRRLRDYMNINYLKRNNMIISKALIKYGYSNFSNPSGVPSAACGVRSLEILEYCTAENAVSREQYYIDLLKPYYNILKTAGS